MVRSLPRLAAYRRWAARSPADRPAGRRGPRPPGRLLGGDLPGDIRHGGVGLAILAEFPQLLGQSAHVLRQPLRLGLRLICQLGAQFPHEVSSLRGGLADDIGSLVLGSAAHLGGLAADQRSALTAPPPDGPHARKRSPQMAEPLTPQGALPLMARLRGRLLALPAPLALLGGAALGIGAGAQGITGLAVLRAGGDGLLGFPPGSAIAALSRRLGRRSRLAGFLLCHRRAFRSVDRWRMGRSGRGARIRRRPHAYPVTDARTGRSRRLIGVSPPRVTRTAPSARPATAVRRKHSGASSTYGRTISGRRVRSRRERPCRAGGAGRPSARRARPPYPWPRTEHARRPGSPCVRARPRLRRQVVVAYPADHS